LAGTILMFRARPAANTGLVGPCQASRSGVVLRLPDRRRSPRAVAKAAARPTCPAARDVDSRLVELLRESVARGEYRVDAKRVARKLMAARGL